MVRGKHATNRPLEGLHTGSKWTWLPYLKMVACERTWHLFRSPTTLINRQSCRKSPLCLTTTAIPGTQLEPGHLCKSCCEQGLGLPRHTSFKELHFRVQTPTAFCCFFFLRTSLATSKVYNFQNLRLQMADKRAQKLKLVIFRDHNNFMGRWGYKVSWIWHKKFWKSVNSFFLTCFLFFPWRFWRSLVCMDFRGLGHQNKHLSILFSLSLVQCP